MSVTVTTTTAPVQVSASGTQVSAAIAAIPVSTVTTGGVGPQGLTNLSDALDVEITSLSAGDLLRFDNARWRNYPETSLLDGGNF